VVDVEAGVHAAVLGQAHRHVGVVVDDRDLEALSQGARDPAEMVERHGEDDDGVHIPLALQDLLQMAAPPRRHPALDDLPGSPLSSRLRRIVLGPAHVRVFLHARQHSLGSGEQLALAVARVWLGAPPGRLQPATTVGGQDQVDTGLVEALPDLPPSRRAAVAEVEIDRGDDG
jgi:hypothetical protein